MMTGYYVIGGRVQGVGFRDFVERTVAPYGLNGWVRNCSDGSVQLCLQAEASVHESLLTRIRQGNRWSRVDSLESHGNPSSLPQPCEPFCRLPDG